MIRIGLARALLVVLLAACDAAASPTPEATSTDVPVVVAPPGSAEVVACIAIIAPECERVVDRLLAALPPERGEPFSVQVHLSACVAGVEPCPESLAARAGRAIVDYADEGLPLVFRVAGTPLGPVLEAVDAGVWTDPIQPGSPRVDGPGPFELAVGHCGVLHVVDFDGSFWVLVGQVDGDHPALLNGETGTIRLLTQNRAEYHGSGDAVLELARFPGPKRFQLCD